MHMADWIAKLDDFIRLSHDASRFQSIRSRLESRDHASSGAARPKFSPRPNPKQPNDLRHDLAGGQ